MGSDLLRQLVHQSGLTPRFRRGDNVRVMDEHWKECHPLWPVLLIEEAQDLNTQSLEEIRLLTLFQHRYPDALYKLSMTTLMIS